MKNEKWKNKRIPREQKREKREKEKPQEKKGLTCKIFIKCELSELDGIERWNDVEVRTELGLCDFSNRNHQQANLGGIQQRLQIHTLDEEEEEKPKDQFHGSLFSRSNWKRGRTSSASILKEGVKNKKKKNFLSQDYIVLSLLRKSLKNPTMTSPEPTQQGHHVVTEKGRGKELWWFSYLFFVFFVFFFPSSSTLPLLFFLNIFFKLYGSQRPWYLRILARNAVWLPLKNWKLKTWLVVLMFFKLEESNQSWLSCTPLHYPHIGVLIIGSH